MIAADVKDTDFITETEGASLGGVTVETVRKFRDCGLLQTKLTEGEERYLAADIKALFSTKSTTENSTQALTESRPEPLEIADNKTVEAVGLADEDSTQLAPVPPAEDSIAAESSVNVALAQSVEIVSQPQDSELQTTKAETESNLEAELNVEKQAQEELSNKTNTDTESTLPPARDLLEATASLMEQIKLLRSERDWLRDRVEKLEVRSEREQMLLLSESENVRKLISSRDAGKSFWRKALPWLNNEENK